MLSMACLKDTENVKGQLDIRSLMNDFVFLMITVTCIRMILYHSLSRVWNYVLKHYEIDTLKFAKIRHFKLSVLILKLTYLP